MGRVTNRVRATRVDLAGDGHVGERVETLVVEAPMEVRVEGQSFSVTMRTPGDDFDLTIGFLLSEGVITSAADVRALMHCQDEDESGSPTYNVVDVALAEGVARPAVEDARRVLTTSACGVCGTASIDAVRTNGRYDVAADQTSYDPDVLVSLPERMREHQKVFDRTGGVHAAGLFTADGELVVMREDIGRHNAVDKVVGWAAREGKLPLTGHVLVVSSRASFELTQKAYVAGIPALVAVSAPSSLAVDLAREVGLTLVAFVRASRLTAYSGVQRLRLAADRASNGGVSTPGPAVSQTG
ncbi:MAG: formate dehydrogenase accessory sulfurtransferase FdhD [Actinomycetota bacterium]|nr:formate dehydrogenase accessory sulfurtransferase FdhD [Actinomycetota bacterium]